MAEYRIICVLKDQNGVITHFKLDNNKTYSKATIINAIGIDSFYTYKSGIKATVLSRQHHLAKEWFLTTNHFLTHVTWYLQIGHTLTLNGYIVLRYYKALLGISERSLVSTEPISSYSSNLSICGIIISTISKSYEPSLKFLKANIGSLTLSICSNPLS